MYVEYKKTDEKYSVQTWGFRSSESTAKYFVSKQTYILIERNSEEFNKTQNFSVSSRTC